MIKEVAFVVIPVSDFKRSRKFYEETLELKVGSAPEGFPWAEFEVGGTTVAIGQHEGWPPSKEGTTVAFEVDDIDATIAKLKEQGAKFDMEKMETPVCFMAQFRDPDGNKLLVHKRKSG